MYELGIHCGYLLSMQAGATTVLRDQFLAIDQGKIIALKPWEESDQEHTKKFINAAQHLVMPGLINGHAHLPMSLLRGLAEDLPFWQWLHTTILPVEKQFVNPQFIRIGTELALLELIGAGVTTVCDMYYFEDVIAEVVDKVGVRAVLGETIADFPTPDNPEGSKNAFDIVANMARTYTKHPRITTCIAPHSPYACSDQTLRHVMSYAEKYDLRIKMHMAESQQEVQESLKHYGLTPVARMAEIGLLNFPTTFAHCVHLNDADIDLLAKANASMIYNPHSNMKLSCGIAPVHKLLQQGVVIGIGTDSAASNNALNIINELATGIKLQKLLDADSKLTTQAMLRMATIDGAKALGLDQQIGSLEVGKWADCIILDISGPNWQPLYDIPASLVYAAQGSDVITTICHGQILMENRELKTLDKNRLLAEVSHIGTKIQTFCNRP
jgi:5-methylthioadenosine/S-adenosylhomocysteine deaminase